MENTALARALRFARTAELIHGRKYPEVRRVRALAVAIRRSDDPVGRAELFGEIRNRTDDYTIPADACGALRATYDGLRAADDQQLIVV